jgi:hypothetical protein
MEPALCLRQQLRQLSVGPGNVRSVG